MRKQKDQPTQSDLVLDATSLVFAQGNKRTASPVTEKAKDAFRKTIREYDDLNSNAALGLGDQKEFRLTGRDSLC